MRTSLSLAGAAALLGLVLAGAAPALADGIVSRSCVGQWGMGNCVTQWRVYPPRQQSANAAGGPPRIEEMSAEAQERDKKWMERCKPMARQDEYGVTRLRYAKPGCEFGKTED